MNFQFFRSLSAIILAVILLWNNSPLPVLADTLPSDPSETTACSDPSSPEASEPEMSEPETSEPETSEPETSEPETSEPETSEPETSEPEFSEPETSEPEFSEPETSEPETSESETSESEASEPENLGPEESESTESRVEEPKPGTSLPEETQPLMLMQPPPEPAGPGLYFGQLHAHSSISDGSVSVADLFASAQAEGMDFFAVTDLSDSIDGHSSSQIAADATGISSDWTAGKAAAAAATGPSFVGIYAYEMNWPHNMQVGHISTFNTPGFQSWDQDAFKTFQTALSNYYDALAAVPASISQFNHPGTQFGNFSDFGHHSETTDRLVSLIGIDCSDKFSRQQYTKALDLGWHLAPTSISSNEDARTVVLAQSLTEEGIYDALRSCRAYATGDPDLEITYTMNGHPMGSRLKRRHISDCIKISVSLRDPTDAAAGTVEVITDGGNIAASQALTAASGTLSLFLPVASGYYYLRITQPDGDMALTAPIWLDAEEQLGISGLTCKTAVPVQNKAIELELALYNGETVDFSVSSLEILADDKVVSSQQDLTVIPASSSISHPVTFCSDCVGLTEITVRLNGTLEGSPRRFEASLSLNFRRAEQVTSILADGSHGNAGADQLEILKQLAMDNHIRLTVAETGLSIDTLKRCRFLLVSAPSQPFSQEFLKSAAEFTGFGGSILICGQGDIQNPEFNSAAELNRLLSAIGSTMRIKDDLVRDAVTNSGDPCVFYSDEILLTSPWCSGISENQVFRLNTACSVDPGNASILISGRSTTESVDGDGDGLGGTDSGTVTLLACETLSGGGTVFASGSLFLSDEHMEEPKNIWDEPFANRTLARNLLGIGGEILPLTSIAGARAAAPGTLVRIRGYATTGTSNPHNTFPSTLYLQDETGGIAITHFAEASIQQGTPLEIVGYTGTQNGNRTLKPGSWKVLDETLYQYQPLQGDWDILLDPAKNGGRFLQVEGVCYEIYCREDDTLAGCLLLDDQGRTVQVKIENFIGNSSDGKNTLHKKVRRGRLIRAAGILHLDEYGAPVIRVRNCEEVVWVPPRNYWNPKTGDMVLAAALSAMVLSLSGLILLRKRTKY